MGNLAERVLHTLRRLPFPGDNCCSGYCSGSSGSARSGCCCGSSGSAYVGFNSTILLANFEGLVLGCVEAKFGT